MPELFASDALAGRAALVTGAAVRVGREIAMALARSGADVAVHYHSSEAEGGQVVDALRGLGRRAVAIRSDLARPEECARTVREAAEGLRGLDLLVHSAANFHRASLVETDGRLWDSAMSVNARAGFLLAREAAALLKRRGGRVVLVSDFLARDPAKNYLAHSVSKSAVEGLVRALAVELAPEVSVNGVAPGTVLPPQGMTEEEVDRYARKVPLKRNGDPDDVASAVVFFCAGPSFITGQVLAVDGGKSLT